MFGSISDDGWRTTTTTAAAAAKRQRTSSSSSYFRCSPLRRSMAWIVKIVWVVVVVLLLILIGVSSSVCTQTTTTVEAAAVAATSRKRQRRQVFPPSLPTSPVMKHDHHQNSHPQSPLQFFPWRRGQHTSTANSSNSSSSKKDSDRHLLVVVTFVSSFFRRIQVPAGLPSYDLRQLSWRLVLTVSGVGAVGVYCHRLTRSAPVRRACYFWKKAGPIVMHYKFTKWWLRLSHADIDKRHDVFEQLHNMYAEPALDLVLHLRGLYIKLGQILSSRPDFMPTQYVQQFTELQDNLPAWEARVVEQYALEQLRNHCPAFAQQYDDLVLDTDALGSASIGQCHRGILVSKKHNNNREEENNRNEDEEVAVKIMHPGAEEGFQNDFQVFRWLCKIALPTWMSYLDTLERQVLTEFDYRNEAQNLRDVGESVRRSRQYRHEVCVPVPREDLCCREVLVMELLHGQKLVDSIRDQLAASAFHGDSDRAAEFLKLRRHEILTGDDDGQSRKLLQQQSVGMVSRWKLLRMIRKCRKVIHLLVDVHGHEIFQDGAWNADPHFGNCLQLDDGRIGLIDYGQTCHLDAGTRRSFAMIVVALEEHRHKPSAASTVAQAMRQAGFVLQNNADDETMMQYARLFFDSDEESERQGYRIPQEYFVHLMSTNELVEIPKEAVFIARTSLLFRGMGHAIGSGQIRTSSRWYKHAKEAASEDR